MADGIDSTRMSNAPHQYGLNAVVLTEASALLSTDSDLWNMLEQLAELLVPALADGCIIDVGLDGQTTLRLVVPKELLALSAPVAIDGAEHAAPQQVHWLRNDMSGEQGMEHDRRPRREALRTIIRALTPTSAVVANIENDCRSYGSLTLVMSSRERQIGTFEQAIADEIAHRIGAVIGQLSSRVRL